MILVAGGTGTLGRRLVPLLTGRDLRVRVLARHPDAAPAQNPSVEIVEGDVRDGASLDRSLAGIQTVVSAVTGFGGPGALGSRAVDRDGNLALIDAARRARVGHVVLLSIHTAAPDHPIELFRDKWAAEEALRASGLAWTIVRPTAYLETWLGFVGGSLIATGRARLFGRGQNPINFVSADDVARFVELAILDAELRRREIEVPGPQNLTLDELAKVVERVSGQPGRVQHLPRPLLRPAAMILGRVNPVLGALMTAGLVMDTGDMTVDGPALRAAYPSIPMTTADEVAARLFGGAEVPAASKVRS